MRDTWGKAGSLHSKNIDGGNILEAPRPSKFPDPPLTPSHIMVLSGYQFSVAAFNTSRLDVNPDGVALGQCHHCGFCTACGCEANAKASPHFTVMPLAGRPRSLRRAPIPCHPDSPRWGEG